MKHLYNTAIGIAGYLTFSSPEAQSPSLAPHGGTANGTTSHLNSGYGAKGDNTNPIVSVRDLNVTLQDHHILQNISFDIQAGEIVCLIGPNGSGKTTLIKALLGLIPYTGSVTILGGLPGAPEGQIGYVPQKIDFDRTIPMTVRDAMNLFSKQPAKHNDYQECLHPVGAENLLKRRLGDLSGGEFQRVMMALALENKPELLILDEPAAGVDVEGETVFYEILNELKSEKGLTVILVSHDLSIVYRYATQVLCVNHSLVCHGIPNQVLTTDTLGKLYGHGALYQHTDRPT